MHFECLFFLNKLMTTMTKIVDDDVGAAD